MEPDLVTVVDNRPPFLNNVTIDVNGASHQGQYRLLAKTVVVYYGQEMKFADTAHDDPKLVARWLMRDLVAAAQ